jgi:hypothetical protein
VLYGTDPPPPPLVFLILCEVCIGTGFTDVSHGKTSVTFITIYISKIECKGVLQF